MSRQTVSALRSFTNKLLKAAALDPKMTMPGGAGQPEMEMPRPRGSQAKVPNVTTPSKPFKAPAAEPEITLPPAEAGADQGGTPPVVSKGRRAAPSPAKPAAPVAQRSWLDALGDLAGSAGNFMTDPTNLTAIGGLGAGGLAGYALGNMFQDDDDDSTPWLSTLAGAGLGIPAALALQHYLGGNRGAIAGGQPFTANDLAAIEPHTNVPALQTSGPVPGANVG